MGYPCLNLMDEREIAIIRAQSKSGGKTGLLREKRQKTVSFTFVAIVGRIGLRRIFWRIIICKKRNNVSWGGSMN